MHYVPVRIDYADVYNLLAFFDGGMDEERTGNHDDLAEEIANAGAEWARTHWRDIDMQACELIIYADVSTDRSSKVMQLTKCALFCSDVFRLTLEWARLIDPAREKQ